MVPAVAGPDHLVPLASLASREHSLVSLRVAIERGRLKGQSSPDGQWRSTRVWLADYLASRYRRSALQAILDAEPMSVPAPGPLRQELGQIRSRSDRPPNHPRLGPGG